MLSGTSIKPPQLDEFFMADDARFRSEDLAALGWTEADLAWFELLLEEQDVDILAWAFGTAAVPTRLEGEQMQLLKKLDYVDVLK